ncbi:MAG: acyl-CoA/acyl-ACP dehydrogenase, partial [Candidatus Lokiarchaeota archaeon]|nr:acyl-CoA/acyl-ACP dehydrogenase [Candidatus Lokiarchaeota archaeon]
MKIQEKIIKDEILEKLEIGNFYKILNQNIFPLLNEEEQAFVKELEDFCIELAPTIDREKDVYVLFPKLGEHGYIQRMNKYKDFTPYGMKYEVLLATILSICDPQLDLARLASGILCGNPTFQHGESSEISKVQTDLMEGKGIGCILITEPERGSDAVNLLTTCEKADDGVIFNGEKIFTTNGPKADYFVGYGVYDMKDPRGTMVQAMFKKEFGIRTERLRINAVPRVHIAHSILEDVKVPYPYILGDDGKGYNYLFDGLIPERISIVGSTIGICWNGLIHGIIYSNLR